MDISTLQQITNFYLFASKNALNEPILLNQGFIKAKYPMILPGQQIPQIYKLKTKDKTEYSINLKEEGMYLDIYTNGETKWDKQKIFECFITNDIIKRPNTPIPFPLEFIELNIPAYMNISSEPEHKGCTKLLH